MLQKNVLIVDDDMYYLHLLEFIVGKLVEHSNISVRYALSGEEALEILRTGCFAGMITDLNMPGMNGYELAVKAKELCPDLDIVIVTSDISPDVPRLAATAGVSRVFDKPYEDAQIREIVLGEMACNSMIGHVVDIRPYPGERSASPRLSRP